MIVDDISCQDSGCAACTECIATDAVELARMEDAARYGTPGDLPEVAS